jgi:hypothetical protein
LALLEQPPKHPDVLVQKWLEDELILVWGGDLLALRQLEGLQNMFCVKQFFYADHVGQGT